jgi:membrane protein implicated in regulation of membrane protease activity
MNRRSIAFLLSSILSLAVLLSVAWAASTEEELKKLETDRTAAVVKGDVATLEKQTSDNYTLINMNGQMSDKSQIVTAFKSGQKNSPLTRFRI